MTASNPQRSNKTLGWFLQDDMFDKKGGFAMRDGANSTAVAQKNAGEEKKRRRGTRRGSKKSISESPSEGSVASDELEEPKQRVVADAPREDYWYYDVATDGYYYEQNGAKGWRRRMPNSALQKIKEQENAQLAAGNGKAPAATAAVAAATLPTQTQAAAQAALLQNTIFSQPSMKYYDPSSDGYFYEMASVDGWKRRQPAAPTGPRTQTMPARPAAAMPSYGSALAKGQMPRSCIIDDSSASSSISEDTVSLDPFGLEAGFQMVDSPFLSRPNSLNYDKKDEFLSGFNADKFIQDLSFSGMDPTKVMGFTPTTPAKAPIGDAWAHSAWSTGNVRAADAQRGTEDSTSMDLLLKGLENIWSSNSAFH